MLIIDLKSFCVGELHKDKKSNNLIHKSLLRLKQFVLNRFVCAFEIYFFDENFYLRFKPFRFVLCSYWAHNCTIIPPVLTVLTWFMCWDLLRGRKRKISPSGCKLIDVLVLAWLRNRTMMIMLIDEGILKFTGGFCGWIVVCGRWKITIFWASDKFGMKSDLLWFACDWLECLNQDHLFGS